MYIIVVKFVYSILTVDRFSVLQILDCDIVA